MNPRRPYEAKIDICEIAKEINGGKEGNYKAIVQTGAEAMNKYIYDNTFRPWEYGSTTVMGSYQLNRTYAHTTTDAQLVFEMKNNRVDIEFARVYLRRFRSRVDEEAKELENVVRDACTKEHKLLTDKKEK